MNLKFTDIHNRAASMIYFRSENEAVCKAIGQLIARMKIHPDVASYGTIIFQRTDDNPLVRASYEAVVPISGPVYVKRIT